MLECIMIMRMSSAAQVLRNMMNKMRRSSREDEGDAGRSSIRRGIEEHMNDVL
jgi:hypothetical protein